MILIKGQGYLTQRDQASKAFTKPSSNRFNNRYHINLLVSNKLGPPEALARSLHTPPPVF